MNSSTANHCTKSDSVGVDAKANTACPMIGLNMVPSFVKTKSLRKASGALDSAAAAAAASPELPSGTGISVNELIFAYNNQVTGPNGTERTLSMSAPICNLFWNDTYSTFRGQNILGIRVGSYRHCKPMHHRSFVSRIRSC